MPEGLGFAAGMGSSLKWCWCGAFVEHSGPAAGVAARNSQPAAGPRSFAGSG